jgi:hypothetical protein
METSFQLGTMAAAAVGGLLYVGDPSRPFRASLALLVVTMALSALIRPVVVGRHPAEARLSPTVSRESSS